jgi:hypothetical protein
MNTVSWIDVAKIALGTMIGGVASIVVLILVGKWRENRWSKNRGKNS